MEYRKRFFGTWKLRNSSDRPESPGLLALDMKICLNPDFTYEMVLRKDDWKCTFSGTYEIQGNQITRYFNGELELEAFFYDACQNTLKVPPGFVFEPEAA